MNSTWNESSESNASIIIITFAMKCTSSKLNFLKNNFLNWTSGPDQPPTPRRWLTSWRSNSSGWRSSRARPPGSRLRLTSSKISDMSTAIRSSYALIIIHSLNNNCNLFNSQRTFSCCLIRCFCLLSWIYNFHICYIRFFSLFTAFCRNHCCRMGQIQGRTGTKILTFSKELIWSLSF